MTGTNITQPNVTLETITPDRARELLACNTENFRKPDDRRVRRFAEEMEKGRWELTGDTIKMLDGVLLDGQHRILACIRSGMSFQTFIAYGIKANAATFDRGKPRTVSQYLSHEGISNANEIAALCRNVICHDRGYWAAPSFAIDYYTDSALIEYAMENNAGLQASLAIFGSNVKRLKLIPRSLAAVFIHIGSGRVDNPENDDLVSWFWSGFSSGANLSDGDPPLTLRNRLLDNRESKSKMSPSYMRYISTIAWNKTVRGEAATILRVRTVGPAKEKIPDRILVTSEAE